MQKQCSPARITTILLILLTCLTSTAFAQSPRRRAAQTRSTLPEMEAAIRGVLEKQVTAWNRGDIESFMDGYHRAPDIVFVSGDDVTRGWATVLERYQRNYDTKEKMGTLAFNDLEIKTLDANHATALGRWQLTRDKDTPHGRFSLIFRRTTSDGWRIVQDTTTSAG